jgi:hypothetical protein
MTGHESMGMVDSLELKVFRPQADGSLKQIAERKTIPAGMNPVLKKAICFLQNFGLFGSYHKDLITNAGLVDIKTLVLNQYGYVGIGTGTTPAAAADTQLETQVETRVVPTKTTTTTTVTNDTAQFSGAFTLTGNRAITESGVFVSSSGGVMLCRQVFSALNLATNDIVTFVWKIQIAR